MKYLSAFFKAIAAFFAHLKDATKAEEAKQQSATEEQRQKTRSAREEVDAKVRGASGRNVNNRLDKWMRD